MPGPLHGVTRSNLLVGGAVEAVKTRSTGPATSSNAAVSTSHHVKANASTSASQTTPPTTKCRSLAVLPATPGDLPIQGHSRGTSLAETILKTFYTCPTPEIARPGKPPSPLREQSSATPTINRADNGGTAAIIRAIGLHRRTARGYRNDDHYRSRVFLVAGGLLRTPQL